MDLTAYSQIIDACSNFDSRYDININDTIEDYFKFTKIDTLNDVYEGEFEMSFEVVNHGNASHPVELVIRDGNFRFEM